MRRQAIAHGDLPPPGHGPSSIAEGLAASETGRAPGRFVFSEGAGKSVVVPFGDMLHRARCMVGGFRRAGLEPGDRAILFLGDPATFVAGVWASMLAGIVVLPAACGEGPRGSGRHAALLPKLRRLLGEAPVVIDRPPPDGLPVDAVLFADELEASDPDSATSPRRPDEPALLILTSGTTGAPSLVALGERALIHRWWPMMPQAAHAHCFLSWAPLDHVLGLGLVSPNLTTKVHLPTDRFVASPAHWLTLADRFRPTHATMTNFGLSLVTRAARHRAAAGETWDLSSLRRIGVGAETVSWQTCRAFLETLRPFGLREDVLIAGYGLSECGPVVGGGDSLRPADADPRLFLPLDRPTAGHSVRVVDDAGSILEESEIGNIEVRGPTMSLGYFGDAEGTARLFTPDGWLRTGDLGRLDDGRLAITGRVKEIVVINARKVACTEIEAAAETVDGVAAAFAVAAPIAPGEGDRGGFALFIVPDLGGRNGSPDVVRRAGAAVAAAVGVAPSRVVSIGEVEIPRTPTGKVRRLELAARLAAGRFDEAGIASEPPQPEPATETERSIIDIWRELLGPRSFGRDEDFIEAGGDSLSAEALLFEIAARFGITLDPGFFAEPASVRRLARLVDGTRRERAQAKPKAAASSARVLARPAIDLSRDADTVAWAMDVAESPNASFYDRLSALELLVACGKTSTADTLFERISVILDRQKRAMPPFLVRLMAANAYFRRIGMEAAVDSLGHIRSRLLAGDEETVLWRSPTGGSLVVVFCTMLGDFWVSGPVLHCLLRGSGAHILYLKDPRRQHYLHGLAGFGAGFDPLVEGIRRIAEDLSAQDIRTMGFSSGGFAALLSGARLGAAAFLGLSSMTRLPVGIARRPGLLPRPPEIPADLRPVVEAARAPLRGFLYHGEAVAGDRVEAERLSGVPGFTVTAVPGSDHNTVLALLSSGGLEAALAGFLGTS